MRDAGLNERATEPRIGSVVTALRGGRFPYPIVSREPWSERDPGTDRLLC